jgi:hypothetical protein
MTMNCPHCQTTLADAATFCPACGATIRPYTPTTFSYLPAGTPSWPTTVPQRPSYRTDLVSPTVTVKETATRDEKPRRLAREWLIIACVLILVPILGVLVTLGVFYLNGQLTRSPASAANTAGGGSTAQAPTAMVTSAPANQLPTPQTFQSLTSISSSLGLTLKYPSNWVADKPQISTDYNSVQLYPQQKLGILFIIIRYSAQASSNVTSADDINQQNMQALSSQANIHNLQLVQPASPHRTISGVSWAEEDASFTDDNGNSIHVLSLSVQHNKLYYNIIVFIPDIYYQEAMQKYIQPMFDSVRFVS